MNRNLDVEEWLKVARRDWQRVHQILILQMFPNEPL